MARQTPASELAWLVADYEQAGAEVPPRLLRHGDRCEAELMSQDEIDEFLRDSVATLKILADNGSARFETLQSVYKADLDCLLAFGRLSKDAYNELQDNELLRF